RNDLIGETQRIAHRAIGGARDHREGFASCFDFFLFENSLEPGNDLCRADALEIRSEEHTSELQSQSNLVCRLLLEKKKKNKIINKYLCLYIDVFITFFL